MTRHAWPFVLPAGALLAALIGSTAGAVQMTVNSLEDTATGDGACTLREAINNANGNRDTTGGDCPSGSPTTPDTIRFAVSGTMTLGSPLPAISDPAGLTIDGTGQSLTVSGNSEPHSVVSVMVVEAGATLNLTGLTVANGWGGIENKGILTIVNSTISNNSSYGIGGISNQAPSPLPIALSPAIAPN